MYEEKNQRKKTDLVFETLIKIQKKKKQLSTLNFNF